MLLEKLPFIQRHLEAEFQVVISQLKMERIAFSKGYSEGDINAGMTDGGTFRVCFPRREGSKWILPIVWGVDRLWSSSTTFRQRWQDISFEHNVTLEMNLRGTTTIVPELELEHQQLF